MSAEHETLRFYLIPGDFLSFIYQNLSVEIKRGDKRPIWWSNDFPVYIVVCNQEEKDWVYIEADRYANVPEDFFRFIVRIEYSISLTEDEDFSFFSEKNSLSFADVNGKLSVMSLFREGDQKRVYILAGTFIGFRNLYLRLCEPVRTN